MNGDGAHLRPQVIRRGDEYVVTNINGLAEMPNHKRFAVAFEVWEQTRLLMLQTTEHVKWRNVDRVVAKMVGVAPSTLQRVREIKRSDPAHVAQFLSGELSLVALERAAGRVVKPRVFEGGKSRSVQRYGNWVRSDKYDSAIAPLLGYLRAWEKQGFEFRHLNPREAKRRLKKAEAALELLPKLKEELERRSHAATSRAPSEKGRSTG